MPNISYTNDASGYTLNTPMPSFGGVTGSGPGIDFSGLNSFYQQMAERKAREEARRREEEARRQAFQEKMQASGFNMNAEEHRAKMQAMQEDRANAARREIEARDATTEVPMMGLIPYQGGQPGTTVNVRKDSLAGLRGRWV
jgi:hypothetical protein